MSNIDDSISAVKAERLRLVKKVMKVAGVSLLIIAFAALLYFLITSLSNSFSADSESSGENAQISAPANTQNNQQNAENQPTLNPAQRAAIQQQLSNTRQRIEGAGAAFKAWRPEQISSLQQQLDNAYELYTAADYTATESALDKLNNDFSQLEADYQAAYSSTYQQALTAFMQGEISRARLLNAEVLRINPSFSFALALQPRLDVYEEVQALWLQSQTARAENNLEHESALLTELLAIDSMHMMAAERIEIVRAELKERAFLQVLNESLQALDAGDLEEAESALNRARRIDRTRAELADVRTRLNAARADRELEQIEQQLALFQEIDEWATVAMVASNALQKYPSHSVSNDALTQASAIVQTQAQLQRYIDSPQRLADLAVLQNAESVLANAERYQHLSPRLQNAIAELEQFIAEANQPVPVVLTSDNRTHVRVLGEGIVGTHAEYSFTLKPGTYQFEGRREGYRSKIVTVVVEQSAAPVSVTLICDERI